MSFLHQRQQQQQPLVSPYPISPRALSASPQKPVALLYTRAGLLLMLSLLVVLGVLFPRTGFVHRLFSGSGSSHSQWRDCSLSDAVMFVAKNGTIIVCAVCHPCLPFLNNWLISIARQKHQEKVLVIAEDYATLVNERRPGHAILVPPAPEAQTAYKFGSQADQKTIWLTLYLKALLIDIIPAICYIYWSLGIMSCTMTLIWSGWLIHFLIYRGTMMCSLLMTWRQSNPLHHSHALPPPGKKGRTYICSCMIFLRPITGAMIVMRKWIKELQEQPWSKARKANDQPAFNGALNKTADQADIYLLPQSAFPSGGLYFKNQTWVQETTGLHVIIHNNYIVGFEKKIKRFKDFGLWLVDEYARESPLGRL